MEDNESKARIDQLDKSEKKETTDSFGTSVELVKSYDGISHNFKRKAARMVSKAFTGVDDTKSKQLFPEQDLSLIHI